MSAAAAPASPAHSVSTATRAVAVDTAAPGLTAVEHLVHRIDDALEGLLSEDGEEGYVVSTHVARTPVGRFVAVLTWTGGPEPGLVTTRLLAGIPDLAEVDGALVTEAALAPGALAATEEARGRTSGRLARYPGRARVERRTTPEQVVTESCLDAVEGLAGVAVTPDGVLDLTGFARPTWRDGRCILLVQQGGDALLPFEVRDQIACCDGH